MARGCSCKPRVSRWVLLGSQADLCAQGWARGEERPEVIRGKVLSRELVQCDELRAAPAGPGPWLARCLQSSGSGHVEARGSSERRGAVGVGGQALQQQWEEVLCLQGGVCEDLEPPTGGPGRWWASCHWKWVSSGSSSSCQGCGRRLGRGWLARSEALPAWAPLGPPSWPGLSRPAMQTCSGSEWPYRLLAVGTVVHSLSGLPQVGGWLCSQTFWSTWQRCQCGSPHV